MQQWDLRVAYDIVTNQVHVYHERVYADDVVSNLWFVWSFTSQHHSQPVTNIASSVRTKECKTRPFIRDLNFNFSEFSRHFNGFTTLAVIVSFLDESVNGDNKFRNGSFETAF